MVFICPVSVIHTYNIKFCIIDAEKHAEKCMCFMVRGNRTWHGDKESEVCFTHRRSELKMWIFQINGDDSLTSALAQNSEKETSWLSHVTELLNKQNLGWAGVLQPGFCKSQNNRWNLHEL